MPFGTFAQDQDEDVWRWGRLMDAAQPMPSDDFTAWAQRPKSTHERRTRWHLLAKSYFRSGQYERAIEILERSVVTLGPHVGLLCDLANAYYLTGQLASWRWTFERVKRELQVCQPLLSENSRIRTQCAVLRFFELDGLVHEIITELRGTPVSLSPGPGIQSTARSHHILMAQALRVAVSFPHAFVWDWKAAYQTLAALGPCHENQSLFIEIQHALFLADLGEGDEARARQRLERLWDLDGFAPCDRRLFLVEWIQWRHLRGLELDSLKGYVPLTKADRGDIFERCVIGVVNAKSEALAENLTFIAEQVPREPILRLHRLFPHCQGLKNEARKILHSLSLSNQKIWLQLLPNNALSRGAPFTLEKGELILKHGEASIILTEMTASLLRLLASLPLGPIPLERVIEDLYGTSDWDPHSHERLRGLVRRLNMAIMRLGGPACAIKLKKRHIIVNKSLILET